MKQCRIAITLECNLNCPYCCMKQSKILNTFQNIKILDLYSILDSKNYDTIMITGGEPLYDPWNLEWYMERFRKFVSRKTKIYLYTNGTLLQKYHLDFLRLNFNGLNIGLHELDSWDYKTVLEHTNKILPVRVLINENLVDKEFLLWCDENGIDYRIWKMDDCHVDEDRYLIKR